MCKNTSCYLAVSEACSPNKTLRRLDFDPGKHNILNSELKHLYTALTRARVNIWIFDEDEEARKPMFSYFQALKLVRTVDKDNVKTMGMHLQISFKKYLGSFREHFVPALHGLLCCNQQNSIGNLGHMVCVSYRDTEMHSYNALRIYLILQHLFYIYLRKYLSQLKIFCNVAPIDKSC
jgi:heptaprenylglyceryl phosphate synthase